MNDNDLLDKILFHQKLIEFQEYCKTLKKSIIVTDEEIEQSFGEDNENTHN